MISLVELYSKKSCAGRRVEHFPSPWDLSHVSMEGGRRVGEPPVRHIRVHQSDLSLLV